MHVLFRPSILIDLQTVAEPFLRAHERCAFRISRDAVGARVGRELGAGAPGETHLTVSVVSELLTALSFLKKKLG